MGLNVQQVNRLADALGRGAKRAGITADQLQLLTQEVYVEVREATSVRSWPGATSFSYRIGRAFDLEEK